MRQIGSIRRQQQQQRIFLGANTLENKSSRTISLRGATVPVGQGPIGWFAPGRELDRERKGNEQSFSTNWVECVSRNLLGIIFWSSLIGELLSSRIWSIINSQTKFTTKCKHNHRLPYHRHGDKMVFGDQLLAGLCEANLAGVLCRALDCRDCNPGIAGNFPIPKSRDWAALNPGILGLTKFIYLTVFLVLFKAILCIYSFFDAFLSPQLGGRGPSCSGRHAIVWAVLKSWL